jgi:hypothetical protein
VLQEEMVVQARLAAALVLQVSPAVAVAVVASLAALVAVAVLQEL